MFHGWKCKQEREEKVMFNHTKTRIYHSVVLVLLLSGTVFAQGSTSLRGKVLDERGSVIIGATVTVTNEDGGDQTVQSDESGEYRFNGLTPGKYTIHGGSLQSDFAVSIFGRDGSAVLLATSFDDHFDANKLQLNFQLVAGKHLLSQVTTSAGTYTLVTRREMIRLAQMQEHEGMTASGTN